MDINNTICKDATNSNCPYTQYVLYLYILKENPPYIPLSNIQILSNTEP